MTIKYTYEQAKAILNAYREAMGSNGLLHVRVRSYGVSKTIAKPFVPSTSTVYSAGFETPQECRDFTIKELARIAEHKMLEGENCQIRENKGEEKTRKSIGKNIEIGNYEKAMRLALTLKDKTLISFITRVIHTKNKVY